MKRWNKLFFTILIPIVFIMIIGFLLYFVNNEIENEELTNSISISAVGDSIGYNVRSEDLSHLKNMITESDIFIFNLEGVLTDSNDQVLRCEGFENQSTFTSNSAFIEKLKLAPINIGNLANNHVLDCGSEGIKETKKILEEHNILSLGAGQNSIEACEPLFVETKGWRVAFVSYNFVIPNLVSADKNKAGAAAFELCNHDYDRIRSTGTNLIIASIHYGYWSSDVTEEQIQLANKLFDLGADIVIGHSPHMPQAIMEKDGKLAFFSLGNFILRPDYKMPYLAHTTIIPRIDVYKNKIDVTVFPVKIDNDGIPHLDNTDEIISRIASVSKDFNTIVEISNNSGHLSFSRR